MLQIIDAYGDSYLVGQNHFPDGSLMLTPPHVSNPVGIKWIYEDDSELFSLICLRRHLNAPDLYLDLPYVPHARMDRVKNETDVFTLKYFCEVINSLKFSKVFVRDVHSNVALALIDNVESEPIYDHISKTTHMITFEETHEVGHEYYAQTMDNLLFFYPDEGAMKRYSSMFKHEYTFGIKHRDWNTGKIQSLQVANPEKVTGKNILIIDDICSYGGTFVHAAEALKAAGAKNIYLYVTHCENSIHEGKVFTSGLIKKVYTTDSLMIDTTEGIEIV